MESLKSGAQTFVDVGKMSVFVVLVDQEAETVMFPAGSVTVKGNDGKTAQASPSDSRW